MESSHSNTNEAWRGVCELAVREHDWEKFRAILKELNRLLEERDQRRSIDLPRAYVPAKQLPPTPFL
jgi:hypothetical protein